MNSLPFPEKLNVKSNNVSQSWDIFKQVWSNYEIASGLYEKEQKQKIATFLMMIGQEALQIYNTFTWNNREKTIETIIEKFDKYFHPKKNVTFERFKLLTRKQNQTEKIDEYTTNLKQLAMSCEFGPLQDSLTKDALVLGLKDHRLREQLLKDSDLTLEKATNTARASELAQEQSEELKNAGNEEEKVFLVKKKKEKRVSKTESASECYACGRHHERNKAMCPAQGKRCNKCSKLNHFANKCRTKPQRPVNSIQDTVVDSSEYESEENSE